jgi:thioredoxin-dependent peroxiredoxin
VQKNFLGKKYMGTERTTFVIDRAGRTSAVLRKVKPGEHVDLVQDALNKL